jgi:hypothetical protein
MAWIVGGVGDSSAVLTGLALDNPYLIAVSNRGVAYRATSPAGPWTAHNIGVSGLQCLGVGAGQCLVGGGLGTLYGSLDGGVTWSYRSLGDTKTPRRLRRGGTLWVVVGSGGMLRTSPDGYSWTPRTSGTTNSLNSADRSAAGIWVAVGNAGVILRSTNGTAWASRKFEGANYADVAWCPAISLFVAVGATGTFGDVGCVRTSPDGLTWSAAYDGGEPFTVVCPTATGAVVFGYSGRMLRATGATWAAEAPVTALAMRAACLGADGVVAGASSTILYEGVALPAITGAVTLSSPLAQVSAAGRLVPWPVITGAVGLAGPAARVLSSGRVWVPVRAGGAARSDAGARVSGPGRILWASPALADGAARASSWSRPADVSSDRVSLCPLMPSAAGASVSRWVAEMPGAWSLGLARWSVALQVDGSGLALWGRGVTVDAVSAAPWQYAPLIGSEAVALWSAPVSVSAGGAGSWTVGVPVLADGVARWGLFWRVYWTPPTVAPPDRPPPPEIPADRFRLFFYPGPSIPAGKQFRLHFGRRPAARHWGVHVITDLSLVRLPGLEPIAWTSLSVEHDSDSVDRMMRATIVGDESYALLQPGLEAAEVRATLNGYPWDALVTYMGGSQGFGESSWSMTARSPIAYLGDDFAPARDYTESALRTARQLAEQELDGLGFTLDWGIADWSVRAGVWSYQGLTPISAIARLAGAAGGVVIDDRDSRTIRVRYRWPIPPWDRAAATPVAVLGDAQIETVSRSGESWSRVNRVVATGGAAGRVRVVATRSGSPGDVTAEVSDSLICDFQVGAQRALQELCGAGRHVEYEVSGVLIPPAPEPPGLLERGDLIEITWRGETWRGQVMGSRIEASFGRLEQSLTVDRYYG